MNVTRYEARTAYGVPISGACLHNHKRAREWIRQRASVYPGCYVIQILEDGRQRVLWRWTEQVPA